MFKKTYIGTTDNIERRLGEHNSGKSFYTKKYLPWVIVSLEKYETLVKARKREIYLKSGAGRRYLKKLFDNIW